MCAYTNYRKLAKDPGDMAMQKVLICSRVSLFPPEHGGAKSFRHLAATLPRSGVQCRVLVQLAPPDTSGERFAGQTLEKLRSMGIHPERGKNGDYFWQNDGVTYVAQESGVDGLLRLLAAEMEKFNPDRVVLSDDTLKNCERLFSLAAVTGRLIFAAQTIHGLPFGPYSLARNEVVTAALKRAMHIMAPSRTVQEYIRAFLGKTTSVYYPPVFGSGPFPALGKWENPFVTLVNPCAWKGAEIFLGLARALPELAFAAVPTWGATPKLLAELRALPNIRVLEETPRIDEIFAQTRILLVPSLCQEAFGLIAPEALLRGIPVLASDLGGLRESTLGAATLLPVKGLELQAATHEEGAAVPWREPENDLQPWIQALRKLVDDPVFYAERSQQSRNTALSFVNSLQSVSPLPHLKLQ